MGGINLFTENTYKRAEITGYEGLYEIDTNGDVHSLITTSSRRKGLIKPYKSSGYLKVNLYNKHGHQTKKYIHRLVAKAFIPCVNDNLVVNHIDGDKTNNSVNNLEWCTQKENIEHSIIHGLQKRPIKTLVETCTGRKYEYSSMKEASLVFFNNTWEIALTRRQKKRDEFYYKDLLIKVGDAICQG